MTKTWYINKVPYFHRAFSFGKEVLTLLNLQVAKRWEMLEIEFITDAQQILAGKIWRFD